jgi:hypothetical protein
MSQYGAAKVAVESLIAQINSQRTLATLSRRIKKKFYTKTKCLKQGCGSGLT